VFACLQNFLKKKTATKYFDEGEEKRAFETGRAVPEYYIIYSTYGGGKGILCVDGTAPDQT
jgi:hypothetical protein